MIRFARGDAFPCPSRTPRSIQYRLVAPARDEADPATWRGGLRGRYRSRYITGASPLGDVDAGLALFRRIRAYRRGSENDARRLRGQLIAVGFGDVVGDAFLLVSGTAEATRQTVSGNRHPPARAG